MALICGLALRKGSFMEKVLIRTISQEKLLNIKDLVLTIHDDFLIDYPPLSHFINILPLESAKVENHLNTHHEALLSWPQSLWNL